MGKKLDKKKIVGGEWCDWEALCLSAQCMCSARELCLANPTIQRFTDSAFNSDQSLNDLILFLLGRTGHGPPLPNDSCNCLQKNQHCQGSTEMCQSGGH